MDIEHIFNCEVNHDSLKNFGKGKKMILERANFKKLCSSLFCYLVLAFSLHYFGYYANKGICEEGLRNLRGPSDKSLCVEFFFELGLRSDQLCFLGSPTIMW